MDDSQDLSQPPAPDEETLDTSEQFNDIEKVEGSLEKLSEFFLSPTFQDFAEHITPQHLAQWLEIENKKQDLAHKEIEVSFQIKKMRQETIRSMTRNIIFGILGILIIIFLYLASRNIVLGSLGVLLLTFLYSGITRDTTLPETLANLVIGAIENVGKWLTHENVNGEER
jgi:uncharacterized membrane protein